MTELLSRPRPRGTAPAATTASGPLRPLWWRAALAGLWAATGVLALCMALGLAAWFASDAGGHGDTRDAIRVGADAWLLAHGTGLALPEASITAVPLGLTLLSLWAAARAGRRAVRTSAPEDLAGTLLGGCVLAGLYTLVVLLTALLAGLPTAQPGLGRAVVGGIAVGLVGGGGGLLLASPATRTAMAHLPLVVRATVTGALAATLLMAAAGSLLVVTALLLDLGEAANVLSRLHPDAAGAALYTAVVGAAAPNAALLGSAYLLGPGFAVGTGTAVTPTGVVLGPMPAFPLLAALPGPGPAPVWATWLLGVPVVIGVVAGALVVRRYRLRSASTGALLGLTSGLVGAALLSGLVVLAGGSVGPGRMADVGAAGLDVLMAAGIALGGGGLVGGLLAGLRERRTPPAAEPEQPRPSDPSTEDTVRLSRRGRSLT